MKIFAYIVSFFAMAEDHGFGRRRGNSKKKNFQKDDIRKASEGKVNSARIEIYLFI